MPARRSFRWSATASSTTRSTTTGTRRSGVLAELRQDFAGVGGDVNFIRTTGDVRLYYELMSDIVSVLRLQGGHVTGWGDKPAAHARSLPDGPEPGARLPDRRHRPARHDVRHLERCARRHDVLGRLGRGADRRSSACRRISACGSRSSPMRVRSGATRAARFPGDGHVGHDGRSVHRRRIPTP